MKFKAAQMVSYQNMGNQNMSGLAGLSMILRNTGDVRRAAASEHSAVAVGCSV